MEVGIGPDAADLQGPDEHSRLGDVLDAAARGAVGAMAMTGMRVLTTELGLVEQTPPEAVSRQHARRVDRLALAADHLRYGVVLSEMHRRPQS